MRRLVAGYLLAAAAALPACTTVIVSQPTLERELAAVRERERLDAVVGRVLVFRDGLLGEATDRGRIDREERAEAAEQAATLLRATLAGVHDGRLDGEGRVDRDLASFLLDAAEEDIRLAALDESRLSALAWPADALQWLAVPGPPDAATIARLADREGLLSPGDAVAPPPADATPGDLRLAGRRLRQAADLLQRRGDEALVLDRDRGAAARESAHAAAGKARDLAKELEERAKKEDHDGDGFAPPSGREEFVALLRTRHGVPESPEAIEAWGRELLAGVTADLEALARAHWPGLTWKEALEKARDDHPGPAAMPAEALAAAEAARDFCIERGLVTIPEEARLAHVEVVGDSMAKTYPFAAYSWRRAGPEGESGRYMVSPGATWMNEAQRLERLRGNFRGWTRVVAPHETWPGHHLQFWYADRYASALRREAGTPVLVEGWGLYSEWLLEHHGHFPRPEERLSLLVMRAWRACRVVLDVRLHCFGMPPEEGIEFLVEHAALTRDAATAEVRRYRGSPTQPFSYAWGWREILRLREEEVRRLGEAFDERAFHDRLLKCGPVPFPFLRRLMGYGG